MGSNEEEAQVLFYIPEKIKKKSFISIDHSKFKIGPGKTNYEACAHEFEAEFFNLKKPKQNHLSTSELLMLKRKDF